MTDLTVFGNTLPAEMREKMALDIAADLARLGGSGGKDTIRITQDKKFMFPDETTTQGPLELVVVDFVYRNEYYPTAFKAKEIVPPTCFAVNDHHALLAPTPNSPKRQVPEGKTCKDCQWDVFGSNASGSGKACKNSVYMAVLPGDATMNSPLMVIKTSPTAITPFNAYITKVTTLAKVSVNAVLTKIFFDPELSYASLRFDLVALNPIYDLTKARQEEARARLLREPDFTGLTTD